MPDGSRMLLLSMTDATVPALNPGEIRMSLGEVSQIWLPCPDEDRYILYNEGYVPHTDQGGSDIQFLDQRGDGRGAAQKAGEGSGRAS